MHLPVGHFFRCLPNDTDDADDEYDVKEQVEQSLSTNVNKMASVPPRKTNKYLCKSKVLKLKKIVL